MSMDINFILKLRRENKLHDFVEDRLKYLFGKLPDTPYTLKEGYGVTSGRTDTSTYLRNGKIIHVEFIASENMIFRDLNNLHQSSADLKLAILIDEEIDPKVAKGYYSANAKNLYDMFWLSEIIDTDRETLVLAKLLGLINQLEKRNDSLLDGIKLNFEKYVSETKLPKESVLRHHFGIFPRKKLNTFGRMAKEDEMYNKLEPFGIREAAGPLWTDGGMSYRFTRAGQFFMVKTPAYECRMFTQIEVGQDGSILFTYCDTRDGQIDELTIIGIQKMLTPALRFAEAIYKKMSYDGMVDIALFLCGVKDLLWGDGREKDRLLSQILSGRKFYDEEVNFPIFSALASELQNSDMLDSFFKDVDIFATRNTKRIEWK